MGTQKAHLICILVKIQHSYTSDMKQMRERDREGERRREREREREEGGEREVQWHTEREREREVQWQRTVWTGLGLWLLLIHGLTSYWFLAFDSWWMHLCLCKTQGLYAVLKCIYCKSKMTHQQEVNLCTSGFKTGGTHVCFPQLHRCTDITCGYMGITVWPPFNTVMHTLGGVPPNCVTRYNICCLWRKGLLFTTRYQQYFAPDQQQFNRSYSQSKGLR